MTPDFIVDCLSVGFGLVGLSVGILFWWSFFRRF